MIPTPYRVSKGPSYWWIWIYNKPAPGVIRFPSLITVARESGPAEDLTEIAPGVYASEVSKWGDPRTPPIMAAWLERHGLGHG